jgi:hypothetical protein
MVTKLAAAKFPVAMIDDVFVVSAPAGLASSPPRRPSSNQSSSSTAIAPMIQGNLLPPRFG